MIADPLRPQRPSYELEGDLLMRVGNETNLAHALQQLPERRISGQVGPEDQRLHEAADQLFDFHVVAVRDRRTDHDVLLSRGAVQQRLKAGEQGHEQRDPFVPAQFRQCPARVGGKSPGLRRSAEGAGVWTGMVQGKLQRGQRI